MPPNWNTITFFRTHMSGARRPVAQHLRTAPPALHRDVLRSIHRECHRRCYDSNSRVKLPKRFSIRSAIGRKFSVGSPKETQDFQRWPAFLHFLDRATPRARLLCATGSQASRLSRDFHFQILVARLASISPVGSGCLVVQVNFPVGNYGVNGSVPAPADKQGFRGTERHGIPVVRALGRRSHERRIFQLPRGRIFYGASVGIDASGPVNRSKWFRGN